MAEALEEDSSQTLIVPPEAKGERLDQYLCAQMEGVSRSRLQDLISEGLVQVNGKPAKSSLKLRGGEVLDVTIPPPEEMSLAPEAIPLEVVYEDSDLLVVNKPQGMATHPAPGTLSGTLVNALLAHCVDLSGIGGVTRPGIVHRLDKDTSGLLVVAKNDLAHQGLSAQIAAKTATRQYLAVIMGTLATPEGTIDAPIGRHPSQRIKMAIVEGGRHAVTHWRVLEVFHAPGRPAASLVELTLETGRTHQIRVHLAHLNRPIVGDPVYAPPSPFPVKLSGQALHAFRLAFDHPRDGRRLTFEVPPPEPFQKLLNYLRQA
jgi:23S rRNA pseudouridine1911/1915/1917 synthase